MRTKKVLSIILIVWLAILMIGGFTLRNTLPGRSQKESYPEENDLRIAFFADPHIADEDMGTETDIGGPAYDIPKLTQDTINKINADYTFGLGDLTAHTRENEWIGYKKWIDNLNNPVYDLLGNHDKDHIYGVGSCGTEYFTEVGRVSGSKVLKKGNNVFILISEEHSPERDGTHLQSTIPQKRFEFLENQLEKYSGSNNIFVMSHTQITGENQGTVAFSETWYYGSNPNWKHISKKYKNILENYENSVVAHLSGHMHTDYRMRDDPSLFDQDLKIGAENVGKFVDGTKIDKAERKYQPYKIPRNYFLNMPIVDIHHNWAIARVGFFAPIVNKFKYSRPAPKTDPKVSREGIRQNLKNPPILDYLHTPKNSYFTGRGAIYYFDMKEGENEVEIKTRWISGNRDVESYEMRLTHPLELGEENMHFVASDLSLMKKNENLRVQRDNWFKIKKDSQGIGYFSKGYYQENKTISGLTIENYDLENYSVKWKKVTTQGKSLTEWHENPENLGEINGIKIKIQFDAPENRPAFIEDIKIQTN